MAEGEQIDLGRFLNSLNIKDALIDEQSIEKEYMAATGEFTGFDKMVSGGETDPRLDKAADLLKDLIVVSKEIVLELKSTHEDIRAVRDKVKEPVKISKASGMRLRCQGGDQWRARGRPGCPARGQ